MRFIPNHRVNYRGGYHNAGEPFEIDPADAPEMAQYGQVEAAAEQKEAEPKPKRTKRVFAEE